MVKTYIYTRSQHRRMSTNLQSVAAALSDDESPPQAPGPKLKHRRGPCSIRRPARGRIVKAVRSICGPNDNPKRLANLIRGACGCKADCFSAFRNHRHRWEEWLKLRKLMAKMGKLEKDAYVGVSKPYFLIWQIVHH